MDQENVIHTQRHTDTDRQTQREREREREACAHTRTHTQEYYLTIKKNEIMFARKRMELQIILLSERRQTQKDKWCPRPCAEFRF
jgi:hypothetical protein